MVVQYSLDDDTAHCTFESVYIGFNMRHVGDDLGDFNSFSVTKASQNQWIELTGLFNKETEWDSGERFLWV